MSRQSDLAILANLQSHNEEGIRAMRSSLETTLTDLEQEIAALRSSLREPGHAALRSAASIGFAGFGGDIDTTLGKIVTLLRMGDSIDEQHRLVEQRSLQEE